MFTYFWTFYFLLSFNIFYSNEIYENGLGISCNYIIESHLHIVQNKIVIMIMTFL